MNYIGNAPLRVMALLSWLCLAIRPCMTSEYCDSKFKSSDKSDSDQARVLRGLAITSFVTENHSDGSPTQYTIGVCGNASKRDSTAGVIQNQTTVLGRVNNTSVVKGGDWMMVILGSGDVYPEQYNCSGPRVAFVMILCNHNTSSEGSMRFIKEAREEKNSCFYMFEIHSQLVCVQSRKIQGSDVFLILLYVLLLFLLGYITGGILYRRLVLGAKGLEQIPNLALWRAVTQGTLIGWRSICLRKNSTHRSSWDNLNPRAERDDDSLLPP